MVAGLANRERLDQGILEDGIPGVAGLFRGLAEVVAPPRSLLAEPVGDPLGASTVTGFFFSPFIASSADVFTLPSHSTRAQERVGTTR
jgi:hypothetical protein